MIHAQVGEHTLEFPDGTPDEVINATVKKFVASQQPSPDVPDTMAASHTPVQQPQGTGYDRSAGVPLTRSDRAVSPGSVPAQQPYRINKPPTKEGFIEGARTVVPAVTGAAGALTGSAFGPVGTIAGGGLGYASGHEVVDIISNAMGLSEPGTISGELGTSVKRVGEGAVYEGIGLGVAKTLPAIAKVGRSLMEKIPVTKAAAKRRAADVYLAATDNGYIVAENAQRAREIEQLTGVRFTKGMIDKNTGALRLEKGLAKKSPGLEETLNSNKTENMDKLHEYFQKQRGAGTYDTVFKELSGEKTHIENMVRHSDEYLARRTEDLNKGLNPQDVGLSYKRQIQGMEKAAKDEANKKYAQISDEIHDAKTLAESLFKLKQSGPRGASPKNIPDLLNEKLNFLTRDPEDIPGLSLRDLQAWRSEILDEVRNAEAGLIDRKGVAKLKQMEQILLDHMDKVPGIDNELLKQANAFYKTNVVDKFYKGTVGKVLAKTAKGDPAVIPSEIADQFFKSGPKGIEAAQDFNRVFGGNQQAQQVMLDMIDQSLYNVSKGKPLTETQLNTWLHNNRYALREYNAIDMYSGLKNAQQAINRAAQNKRVFDGSVASKMLGTDADRAAAKLLTGDRVKNAKEIMQRIGDNPQAVEGMQNAVIDDIIRKATDAGEFDTISIKRLAKNMEEYRPVIKQLFAGKSGQKKLQSLGVVQDALKIMDDSKIAKGTVDLDTFVSDILNRIKITKVLPSPGKSRGRTIVSFPIVKHMVKFGEENVMRYLRRAVTDPDFAETLVDMAQGKLLGEEAVNTVTQQMISKGMMMGQPISRLGDNNE